MRKHVFIPDLQVTPDTPTDHLEWIAEFTLSEKPDSIIQIGDWGDMKSLGVHDRGKISFEGRRYSKDIEATHRSLEILDKPFKIYNQKAITGKRKQYHPDKHITLGNHEDRITRCIQDNPILDGTISIDDLRYQDYGWLVHDFLKPIEIDGVTYCHYFQNQLSGKPIGGKNIDTRIKEIGFSFTMGHQQIKLSGQRPLSNGRRLMGLVCGAAYIHEEGYQRYQGNTYWRGIFVKNEVRNGEYDLHEVSLNRLCQQYEGMPLWKFMSLKYPSIFENSVWLRSQESGYSKM